MPWGWPFVTMIRDQDERPIHGGRKRDRSKTRASRRARKANRR